ncbi:hypothetical protein SynA1560_02123 [Synechococcus sp. A15-60]|nr:hypothetical protein SynA1560_02123 [Synechococcus sp. A15-60]
MVNEDEPMFWRISSALILSVTVAGCNIDVDNLENCTDKDGKPLPEWVCRKNTAPAEEEK